MKAMTPRLLGMLPEAKGRWSVQSMGGTIFLVNEDEAAQPMAVVDGVLRPVVEFATSDAPLILPRELA